MDVGTLGAIIDGQVRAFDLQLLGILRKVRLGSVKGAGQQPIAARGGIHRFKPIFRCEGLVREPGLLLFGTQHTHTGFPLGFGVGQAVLHQMPAVALALKFAGDPQAVDVEIILSLHWCPGGLQRSVLDEHHTLGVQLAEHMAFPEPLGQPGPLGFHAGVGLLAADNAAQMLVGKVIGCQIDEFSIHGRLFNGMSGRHALR